MWWRGRVLLLLALLAFTTSVVAQLAGPAPERPDEGLAAMPATGVPATQAAPSPVEPVPPGVADLEKLRGSMENIESEVEGLETTQHQSSPSPSLAPSVSSTPSPSPSLEPPRLSNNDTLFKEALKRETERLVNESLAHHEREEEERHVNTTELAGENLEKVAVLEKSLSQLEAEKDQMIQDTEVPSSLENRLMTDSKYNRTRTLRERFNRLRELNDKIREETKKKEEELDEIDEKVKEEQEDNDKEQAMREWAAKTAADNLKRAREHELHEVEREKKKQERKEEFAEEQGELEQDISEEKEKDKEAREERREEREKRKEEAQEEREEQEEEQEEAREAAKNRTEEAQAPKAKQDDVQACIRNNIREQHRCMREALSKIRSERWKRLESEMATEGDVEEEREKTDENYWKNQDEAQQRFMQRLEGMEECIKEQRKQKELEMTTKKEKEMKKCHPCRKKTYKRLVPAPCPIEVTEIPAFHRSPCCEGNELECIPCFPFNENSLCKCRSVAFLLTPEVLRRLKAASPQLRPRYILGKSFRVDVTVFDKYHQTVWVSNESVIAQPYVSDHANLMDPEFLDRTEIFYGQFVHLNGKQTPIPKQGYIEMRIDDLDVYNLHSYDLTEGMFNPPGVDPCPEPRCPEEECKPIVKVVERVEKVVLHDGTNTTSSSKGAVMKKAGCGCDVPCPKPCSCLTDATQMPVPIKVKNFHVTDSMFIDNLQVDERASDASEAGEEELVDEGLEPSPLPPPTAPPPTPSMTPDAVTLDPTDEADADLGPLELSDPAGLEAPTQCPPVTFQAGADWSMGFLDADYPARQDEENSGTFRVKLYMMHQEDVFFKVAAMYFIFPPELVLGPALPRDVDMDPALHPIQEHPSPTPSPSPGMAPLPDGIDNILRLLNPE